MKVRSIASALPENRYDSEAIAGWLGSSPAFLREKIGVEQRGFLGAEETGVVLAHIACMNLVDKEPLFRFEDVECLVFVTQTPDYKIPHSSALLQHRLGLPVSTACFDLGLGCSGYVYGLSVISGFMQTAGMQNGLLVTCDPYSRIMTKGDKDTISVFGDAATATWISAAVGGDVGKTDFGTDGSGAENLIVRNGGGARPFGGVFPLVDVEIEDRDYRLHMNGRAIFNFMLQRVPETLERCAALNGVALANVDYIVLHQASRFLLETLVARMDLDERKVPIMLEKTANTVSSSIPLVLESMLANGSLVGRTALVSGFGAGLSWASTMLQF